MCGGKGLGAVLTGLVGGGSGKSTVAKAATPVESPIETEEDKKNAAAAELEEARKKRASQSMLGGEASAPTTKSYLGAGS